MSGFFQKSTLSSLKNNGILVRDKPLWRDHAHDTRHNPGEQAPQRPRMHILCIIVQFPHPNSSVIRYDYSFTRPYHSFFGHCSGSRMRLSRTRPNTRQNTANTSWVCFRSDGGCLCMVTAYSRHGSMPGYG